MASLAFISADERPLALDIQSFSYRLVMLDISGPLKDTVLQGGAKEVTIVANGVLQSQVHLCVPNVDGLREKILEEAHSSLYYVHSGATKMYYDLRQHYWLQRMKKHIVEYVERCLNASILSMSTRGKVAYFRR
ncbi:uncharacterized protein [Nicotiana tomentosiformis]|uniref:uncharacterized protein n=1 Tax=Nicotiana tomentosiformis TaxID=4098 RepID=UPI00388CECB0